MIVFTKEMDYDILSGGSINSIARKYKISWNSVKNRRDKLMQEEKTSQTAYVPIISNLDMLLDLGVAEYLKVICSKQSDCDKLICDLTHSIELEKHTESDKVEIFGKLKDALLERRKYKDEALCLSNIKPQLGTFCKVLNELRTLDEKLKHRKYIKRIKE